MTHPAWAADLGRRYLAGESSMFLLHGNTRDLFPMDDGTLDYLALVPFLERFLARTKDVVITYNVSQGVRFAAPAMKARCMAAINARRAFDGRAPLDELPKAPAEVLPILEALVTDTSQRAAVVIDFFETIVPMSDLSFMSDADKATLVSMQRLGSDPRLLASDNLLVLVTEHLSDVHRRVVASAQLAPLRIPLPDESGRAAFIEWEDKTGVDAEMNDPVLAAITAGLSLIQIQSVFRRARQSGETIRFSTVSRRKKEIIERECHGLVEFVEPGHTFAEVGGLEGLKTDLMRVATAIKRGEHQASSNGHSLRRADGHRKDLHCRGVCGGERLDVLEVQELQGTMGGLHRGQPGKDPRCRRGLGPGPVDHRRSRSFHGVRVGW